MISILLIDDNASKIRAIKEVIINLSVIEESDITVANDRVNAKRLLLERQFDLMILDIQLPERFGDTPDNDGGVEFLEELNMDEEFIIPFHIIGLTAYSDLLQKHSEAFSNNLWHLIHYDDSYTEWKEKLSNHLRYLVKSKSELRIPSNQKYVYDIAIVTVLSLELKYVRQLPWNWQLEKFDNDNSYYYTGFFMLGTKKIKVVATSTNNTMGMCAAAALSMKVINRYLPKYITMVGICAGVKGKGNIGDPIFADRVWDYGSGKHVIEKDENGNSSQVFKPYINQIPLDVSLSTALTQIIDDELYLQDIHKGWPANSFSPLKAHLGPFASGSAVIANEKMVGEIKNQHGQLIGFDMESYSIFYSALHSLSPKPTPFIVKSVSDFGDSNKNNPDKDLFQEYAAYTSANYFSRIVMNHLTFS